MAKPSITKRSVKGAALTYNELDTNFQNLADATVSLTAGTGGTKVTTDLNGNITLVAGTGITLSGDNTGKTITITNSSLGANSFGKIVVAGQSDIDADSTNDTLTLVAGSNVTITTNPTTDAITIASSVTGITNPLTSNLITGSYKISKGSAAAIDLVGGLRIQNYTNNNYALTLGADSTSCVIDPHFGSDLTLRSYNSSGQVEGFITLDRNGLGVSIGASYNFGGVILFSDGLTRHVGITTTQRNTLTAQPGMMIFNSTTNKFQGYDGTNWVDLH